MAEKVNSGDRVVGVGTLSNFISPPPVSKGFCPFFSSSFFHSRVFLFVSHSVWCVLPFFRFTICFCFFCFFLLLFIFFFRFLSVINSILFASLVSGVVKSVRLFFCFCLFYYRGVSSTPELLEPALRPRTALHCVLMCEQQQQQNTITTPGATQFCRVKV